MHGSKVLFQDLTESNSFQSNGKGRNKRLYENRNKALMHRYWYYKTFTDTRYEKIIEIVADEFFLAPYTVSDLLMDNVAALKILHSQNPSVSQLKTDFPQFNWSLKSA